MEEPLIETRNKYKEWIVWIPFFVIPLLFYPGALRSSWVSNSNIYVLLEFGSAVITLSAAFIILIHFFATGKKFFLLFSLEFTLQGTEDLVHAITENVDDSQEEKGLITASKKRNGDWAEIRISDNGTGIPENIRSKIFNPFLLRRKLVRV